MTPAEISDALVGAACEPKQSRRGGVTLAKCPSCSTAAALEVRRGGDGQGKVQCAKSCTTAQIAAALGVDLNEQPISPKAGNLKEDEEPEPKKKSGKERADSAAIALVEIGSELPLFTDAAGRAYCLRRLPAGGVRALALKSRDFHNWLAAEFFRREQRRRAAPAEAIASALSVLQALAAENEQVEVGIRVAEHEGSIYLDLADDAGRVVVLSALGWRVANCSPVPFRKAAGMLALPEPVRGGAVDELRALLNVGDDDWKLIVGWLVAALRPNRPFSILALQGEHGSAKTTAARLVRGLVDPSKPAVRKKPRDERSLSINAQNSWVLSYDNLSGLPDWLSDALCGIATGSGFGDRLLHSDFDEALFDAKRPIMANGIDEIATRPDLADRCLRIELRPISDEARLEEEEVETRYAEMQPRILGALCTAVCGALRDMPATRLVRKPRMADFARWATAAESSLKWAAGDFMRAYSGNRAELAQHSLENDPVAEAVVRLIRKTEGEKWQGTMGELLDLLTSAQTRPPKGWPETARGLSNAMRRAAPVLSRAARIHYSEPEETGHDNRRILVLQSMLRTPRMSRAANSSNGFPASDARDASEGMRDPEDAP